MSNRRFGGCLFAALATCFISSSAGAVEVSLLGSTSATIVRSHESFSIDLAVDNVSMDSTSTFEVTISGLAAAGAELTNGMAAESYFNAFCFPGSGCFNGITAVNDSSYNADDLSANFTLGDDTLVVVKVAGATFSSHNGAIDLGLANDIAGATPDPHDAHIELVAHSPGVFSFVIGGTWSDGVDTFPLATEQFALYVSPEPGTGVLLSLGLLGLSATRRRPRREDSRAGDLHEATER